MSCITPNDSRISREKNPFKGLRRLQVFQKIFLKKVKMTFKTCEGYPSINSPINLPKFVSEALLPHNKRLECASGILEV